MSEEFYKSLAVVFEEWYDNQNFDYQEKESYERPFRYDALEDFCKLVGFTEHVVDVWHAM